MSSPSLTPDEIRAAAETHHELGPEYQSAVIESFLDKVGREIDARVDARLASHQVGSPAQYGSSAQYGLPAQYGPPVPFAPPGQLAARPARERGPFALAVTSMALGIPLSAIAMSAGPASDGIRGLVVIWIAIAVINVAYYLHLRPPASRR